MFAENDAINVLIVSGSLKGAGYISGILSDENFRSVQTVYDAGEAKRILVNKSIDIVLINTPLTDELGGDLALDAAKNDFIGILLLVSGDLYDQISVMVGKAGILTLQKPASKQLIIQSMKLLTAAVTKIASIHKKSVSLESRMEDIRIINRAKLILIEHHFMSESQAHRYIERSAMDTCVKRREIAENIIHAHENNEK